MAPVEHLAVFHELFKDAPSRQRFGPAVLIIGAGDCALAHSDTKWGKRLRKIAGIVQLGEWHIKTTAIVRGEVWQDEGRERRREC
eukprot:scaffold2569_cov55-Phaeocystis_antarctica.AAC.10